MLDLVGQLERLPTFRVDVPEAKLRQIRQRVASYPWFPAPEDEGEVWRYGVNTAWLRRLCEHWVSGYDWRAAEQELNRYPQFVADIDGVKIHFVAVVGEAKGRRPLLLVHGWPGSHYEFWKVADRLANPSRHGGDPADAFDLIIPSLPGYGFSGPSREPIGPRRAAGLLDKLMTDVLGLPHYIVQGGDWGAVVATFLGIDHPKSCSAIHLNLIGLRPTLATAQTDEEVSAIQAIAERETRRLAYATQHTMAPQTLAMALMDSPVGTAAWILDKFHDWSDLGTEGIDKVYERDELLTNVMIYLVNDTIATSLWSYRGAANDGIRAQPGMYCSVPTAVFKVPFENVGATPPRSWVERYYNLVQWTEAASGGHFAALERPAELTEDIRAFGRAWAAPPPGPAAGQHELSV